MRNTLNIVSSQDMNDIIEEFSMDFDERHIQKEEASKVLELHTSQEDDKQLLEGLSIFNNDGFDSIIDLTNEVRYYESSKY